MTEERAIEVLGIMKSQMKEFGMTARFEGLREMQEATVDVAVKALSEIQQYRAIGTVEEIKKVVQFLSLDNDNGIIEDLQLLNKYQFVGTVEECREARERQSPIKPKGRYKTRYVWDSAYCPICECGITARWNFCQKCGQAIDWSE